MFAWTVSISLKILEFNYRQQWITEHQILYDHVYTICEIQFSSYVILLKHRFTILNGLIRQKNLAENLHKSTAQKKQNNYCETVAKCLTVEYPANFIKRMAIGYSLCKLSCLWYDEQPQPFEKFARQFYGTIYCCHTTLNGVVK
jgi:hypothetical protein